MTQATGAPREPVGDLARSVTSALSAVAGSELLRVVLRTLDGELTERVELGDPQLYIGGEARLDFAKRSIFVSWAAREGWETHNSIAARTQSLFAPDASLRDWNVSDLTPWSRCIGSPLDAARVFSIHRTPHVVELSFGEHTCWLASGHQHCVGDGDDLLIRAGRFPPTETAELAWTM